MPLNSQPVAQSPSGTMSQDDTHGGEAVGDRGGGACGGLEGSGGDRDGLGPGGHTSTYAYMPFEPIHSVPIKLQSHSLHVMPSVAWTPPHMPLNSQPIAQSFSGTMSQDDTHGGEAGGDGGGEGEGDSETKNWISLIYSWKPIS